LPSSPAQTSLYLLRITLLVTGQTPPLRHQRTSTSLPRPIHRWTDTSASIHTAQRVSLRRTLHGDLNSGAGGHSGGRTNVVALADDAKRSAEDIAGSFGLCVVVGGCRWHFPFITAWYVG